MAKRQRDETVAQYVERLVNNSPKNQREISEEIGFKRPNILSMLKRGEAKVPLDKVHRIAVALGENPKRFALRVIEEYLPGLHDSLEEVLNGQPVLSENEIEIINTIRQANPNDPAITSEAQRQGLIDLFSQKVH